MLLEAGWSGAPGLKALCGGEALPADLADRLLERVGELWNMYGPTETTVWSTAGRVSAGDAITIGTPIANTQVYVLDGHRQPVPIGAPGELWIAGDGLARGYHRRPDLTADRFEHVPFDPSRLMYRTGDLARWRADGRLDHLGRVDQQVKIRGFRIELGDIESALASHGAVKQAVVAVREDGGDARLAAYVIPEPERAISTEELRLYLKMRLPHYMLPASITLLNALPLTPNGKIDRRALPAPVVESAASAQSPREAASPVEDTLAAVWADVLHVPRVGLHDDFFELGGHSLLAARLMKLVNETFWLELPLRVLFEAPTVASLARVILAEMGARRGRDDGRQAGLITINPEGARPAFFFLHAAIQGDGFYCYNLARHLGDDQPVYAIPPVGLDGRPAPPTIEESADIQLEVIRRIQPKGPYYLGGFCISGVVALEVARKLQAAGEEVTGVLVVETRTHHPHVFNRMANLCADAAAALLRLGSDKRLALVLRLRPHAVKAWDLYQAGLPVAGVRILRSLRRRLRAAVSTVRRAPRPAAPARPAGAFSQELALSAVFQAQISALHGYLPTRMPFPVACLWAEEEPMNQDTWRLVAPGVHLETVPGNHNTCITTQTAALGRAMRRALDRAELQSHARSTTAQFPAAKASGPTRVARAG
jgi:thioesterase domain-containing protein